MPVKEKLDWAQFSRAIYINTDIATAYRMWASGAGLMRWWLARAVFHPHSPVSTEGGDKRDKSALAARGDRFEWTWFEGAVLEGRVLEANGKDLFAFSFGGNVTVQVKFIAAGDRTLVELVQDNMASNPAGQKFYIGCTTAWAAYLTNLKSVLEGGLDLREKKPDRPNLVNA